MNQGFPEFKPTLEKLARKLAGFRPRRIHFLSLASVSLAFIVATSLQTYSLAMEVSMDGRSLGCVSGQEALSSAVTGAQKRAERLLQDSYLMEPNLSVSWRLAESDQIQSDKQLEWELLSTVEELVPVYTLRVDGTLAGAVSERRDLSDLVEPVVERWSSQGRNAELLSEIAIEREMLPKETLKTREELAERLEDLIRVRYTTIEKVTEELPFEELQVEDDALYLGRTEVRTQGVTGEQVHTVLVTHESGQELSRKTLHTAVTRQVVDQVVAVGTREGGPTGIYIRPFAAGKLSSDYGYRSRGFHTGVDFCGKAGSNVVASDGGTVVFAGWSGGYGNIVKLSHGDGVETWYAHNSQILVSVGQEVNQGDVIALVGSTGNSTGPHCHFEVRIDGQHVNPWGYIS